MKIIFTQIFKKLITNFEAAAELARLRSDSARLAEVRRIRKGART